MKTDVIFLGAGASVRAGFPDNRELANFIINGMELEYDRTRVEPLREELRRTNFLSVDEFCWKNNNPAEVQDMKRIARYALAVYPYRAKQKPTRWDSPSNPYRNFIDTLFFRGEVFPEPRFTIVNFNYDGLLAKLLADAVWWRAYNEGKTDLAEPWRLAAVGGGYFHFMDGIAVQEYDLNREDLRDCFMHLMPHGTITVLRSDPLHISSMSEASYVYPNELSANSDIWQRGLKAFPAIDFPWEPDGSVSKMHRGQLGLAARAVKEANRIHFIGLAGHYLMRDSLSRIFEGMSEEEFARKEWFIATKESDYQRTFWNICECFLPDQLLKNDSWRRNNLRPQFCGDFDNWMYLKPHHNPVVEPVLRQNLG
jgi:hypothetical protein